MPIRPLCFLVVALASCAACASRSTATSGPGGETIETIAQEDDFYSGELEHELTAIVNSQGELEKLWNRVYAGHIAPELPTVDFALESVVLATPGVQRTGGHSVEIDAIQEIPEGVRLIIRTEAPGGDCIVTESETTPMHIVRVRKLPGVVLFEWVPEVIEC